LTESQFPIPNSKILKNKFRQRTVFTTKSCLISTRPLGIGCSKIQINGVVPFEIVYLPIQFEAPVGREDGAAL
jgi:hypothetical protein